MALRSADAVVEDLQVPPGSGTQRGGLYGDDLQPGRFTVRRGGDGVEGGWEGGRGEVWGPIR